MEPERKAGEGGLRQAMPGAAALVDELRQSLGRDWVDAALREGLRLQREHARQVAELGQAVADAWLARRRSAVPTLALEEGGRWIGALPGNVPEKSKRAAARLTVGGGR